MGKGEARPSKKNRLLILRDCFAEEKSFLGWIRADRKHNHVSRREQHLRLADRPADYQKLGIDPIKVAQFEDGQRIGTEKGRYEWWYFDAHLDDGASVVVVFYTKPNVSPNGPLAPRITIN